jgi:hypothetical protein
MTPIDLVDYAHRSKKIPAAHLKHKILTHQPVALWKIISAHTLDGVVAVMTCVMISGIFTLYLKSFMISSSLLNTFDSIPFYGLIAASTPLMFVGYHFFSYFFNQGQTWGMHYLKIRITIPEQSFRSSFVWALFSFSTMLTAGLTFKPGLEWLFQNGHGQHAAQDHLWIDLIQERALQPMNLVDATFTKVQEDKIEQEEFAQAA